MMCPPKQARSSRWRIRPDSADCAPACSALWLRACLKIARLAIQSLAQNSALRNFKTRSNIREINHLRRLKRDIRFSTASSTRLCSLSLRVATRLFCLSRCLNGRLSGSFSMPLRGRAPTSDVGVGIFPRSVFRIGRASTSHVGVSAGRCPHRLCTRNP